LGQYDDWLASMSMSLWNTWVVCEKPMDAMTIRLWLEGAGSLIGTTSAAAACPAVSWMAGRTLMPFE
jgi:hypothetical protein